jgi:hypothetical protein
LRFSFWWSGVELQVRDCGFNGGFVWTLSVIKGESFYTLV